MEKLIALSAIGRDRPGIVAALSRVLFEKGCNLEDSSMTRLKGDFAVLLLLSLPEGLTPDGLRAALDPAVRDWNLALTLRPLAPGEMEPSPTGDPYTLVVYGLDHPGIVHRVTRAAADRGLNITDLRTHVTEGTGAPLYSLVVDLESPGKGAAEAFQADLEALKKELQVEVTFHPAETDEL